MSIKQVKDLLLTKEKDIRFRIRLRDWIFARIDAIERMLVKLILKLGKKQSISEMYIIINFNPTEFMWLEDGSVVCTVNVLVNSKEIDRVLIGVSDDRVRICTDTGDLIALSKKDFLEADLKEYQTTADVLHRIASDLYEVKDNGSDKLYMYRFKLDDANGNLKGHYLPIDVPIESILIPFIEVR